MVVVSLIILLFAFFVAVMIRAFALFLRARIYFRDTFTIVIWIGTPLLFLLPISIILIRLLVYSPGIIWVILVISLLAMIWIWFRMLRATAVVFDKRIFKVYTAGFSLLLIIIAALVAIYHYQFSIIGYGDYLFKMMLQF